jgi:O-acetyl-ADP-ribose deacetylase (regulator of RNase III)
MKINFVKGDATRPIGDGNKMIIHCCNDINAFGAGFVLALNRRWYEPEKRFHEDFGNLELGDVQFVQVEDDIIVANMIGQHGIGYDENGNPPIRYDAIKTCLEKVNNFAMRYNYTIHAPRFGAGLSGGDWFEIEKLIHETIKVDVTIYDLK